MFDDKANTRNFLPYAQAWAEAEPSMKKVGGQFQGPCPACGEGEDRFRVSDKGVYCNQCCPDGSNKEAFKRLREAIGYDPEQPTRPRRETAQTAQTQPKREPAPEFDLAAYPELSGAESNRPEIPEGSEPSGGAQAAGIPEAGNSGGKQPLPTGRKRSWKYRSVEGGTVTVHRTDPTEDQAREGVPKRIRRGKSKAIEPFLPLAEFQTGEDAPDYGIVICEGEATCDALCEAGINATTGIGGIQLAKSTDWTVIPELSRCRELRKKNGNSCETSAPISITGGHRRSKLNGNH